MINSPITGREGSNGVKRTERLELVPMLEVAEFIISRWSRMAMSEVERDRHEVGGTGPSDATVYDPTGFLWCLWAGPVESVVPCGWCGEQVCRECCPLCTLWSLYSIDCS